MSITFSSVSPTSAASAVFVEQEAVKRGTGSPVLPRKILAIGQYNAGKNPTNNVARLITSKAQAWKLYGRGSMLSLMLDRLLVSGGGIPVYALPVADGTRAASGRIVLSGGATAAGILSVYIAGERLEIPVASGDTVKEIGDALASKVNATLDLPVTASNANGTVTFTVKWKGDSSNQVILEVNSGPSDAAPAGVGVALTHIGTTTAGAGDPDLRGALSALGDTWYTDICVPYTHGVPLGQIESTGAVRVGPNVRRPFVGIAGYNDDSSSFRTVLGGRDSEWTTFVPVYGSPTPAFMIAASATAVFAASQQTNPGRPMKGLMLPGVIAGGTENDLTYTERDSIVKAGGSHTYDLADGTVRMGDLCTTRTTDPTSGADSSDWRFTIILSNLQFKIYALEQTFRVPPFARAVVLSDADGRGPTYGIRPSTVKGYLIGLVDDWIGRGLSTNRDEIVDNIKAEISKDNPGRIDALIPDIASAGLRIVALKLEWAYITG